MYDGVFEMLYLTFLATIKERRAEFEELVKSSATIKADCAHFGLPEPDFALV